MRRHARLLMLSVLCLAGAGSGPARAATQMAAVQASVIKPLTLSSLQNLDFGTVMLKPGTWSGATLSLSRAGVLNCSNPNLICSGATMTARYNVTGTNRMVVRISTPDVILVNSSDSSQTLKMVIDSPGTVTLTSSGAPGSDFDLGGTITLSSSTASGDYTGTFAVTADYQ